jgi:hypothetical protein
LTARSESAEISTYYELGLLIQETPLMRNIGKTGGFDGFLNIEQDGLLPGSETVFAYWNDH